MNKNGWIYWEGGECPVEAGTLVDVIYRCGYRATDIPALVELDDGLFAVDWKCDLEDYDIIAYRLSEAER